MCNICRLVRLIFHKEFSAVFLVIQRPNSAPPLRRESSPQDCYEEACDDKYDDTDNDNEDDCDEYGEIVRTRDASYVLLNVGLSEGKGER